MYTRYGKKKSVSQTFQIILEYRFENIFLNPYTNNKINGMWIVHLKRKKYIYDFITHLNKK